MSAMLHACMAMEVEEQMRHMHAYIHSTIYSVLYTL